MFKAIKSYSDGSSSNHTLSFNSGDTFCLIEKTNSNWWLVSNESGKIGYVPSSYIKSYEKEDEKDVVLTSIDRAISSIYASSNSGNLPQEQLNMIRKLKQHKESFIATSLKRHAPPPPSRSSVSGAARAAPPPPQRSVSTKRQAPSVPSIDKVSNVTINQSTINVKDCSSTDSVSLVDKIVETKLPLQTFCPKIPAHLGQELISKMQSNWNFPETKAREVVQSLLLTLGENMPELMKSMQEIIESFPEIQDTPDPFLENLRLALANINEIKEDGQQNNWAIEDDEEKISEILEEILKALTSVQKTESIAEFSYNDYEYLAVLAAYHQMESRVSLRILVLQIFGVICSLSSRFVSFLMSTVLPLELVQDLTVYTEDIQRFCYSALVLSMLFSTGEPIPLSYYDTINEKLLTTFLEYIENGLNNDTDDQATDILVRLVLAINLHFVVPADNLAMTAITNNRCIRLSEKIMLLINRGEDPVKIGDEVEQSFPNSVIKFLQDIFSRDDTATTFLYTNDLHVLVDIIIRNLSDLPSGVKLRTDYLDLLLNLIQRSSYNEEKHRISEISSILKRIEIEELPVEDSLRSTAEFDKIIVKKILLEHLSKSI